MSETHTPGPWRVNEPPDGLAVLAADGREICSLEDADADGEGEANANALLIAAAPALLYAAQEALARLEEFTLPDDEPAQDAAQFLREAIARATQPQ